MTNLQFLKRAFLMLLVCSILMLGACFRGRKQLSEINPEFGKYIAGYTSGIISKRAPIRIQLIRGTDDGAPGVYMEQDQLEKIFELDPAVKGKVRVEDGGHIISFIPEKDLQQGQLYDVHFNLGKLLKVEKSLTDFHFQFATRQQSIRVELGGLSNYDHWNVEWEHLEGRIKTEDAPDSAALCKCITAEQDGKPLKVHVFYNQYENNDFEFQVDSVKRNEKKSKVTVSWNGGSFGLSNLRESETVDVVPLGDFSVDKTVVTQEPDESVALTFSDPLKPTQDLNGIVTIEGIDNLTYHIENNNLNVFIPGHHLGSKKLRVGTGIKNFKGYKMQSEYVTDIVFDEPKPRVRLIGNGVILPGSNKLLFPFEAVGLKSIDVRVMKIFENNVQQFLQVNGLDGENELQRVGKKLVEKKIFLDPDKKSDLHQWNHYSFDLAKFINPEQGAIYRVDIKFNKKDAACDCPVESIPDNETGNEEEPTLKDKTWNEGGWGGYEYGFNQGYESYNYDYSDSREPCDESYYYGKAVGRNILASDLGITAKIGEDRIANVFVSNLIRTDPVGGTTIDFFDYQHQLICSTVTDANGMADISLKSKPFLLVAKYGKQRGYLKMKDEESNSLSKFDVSGEVVQKGVKGFIYGERGVWRPGDSLFLSFIMEDKLHQIPANHPVSFELLDPANKVVQKIVHNKSVAGIYDFRTATDPDAPTGNWTAQVKVGNRIFTHSLKVETVKPNRLKIYLDFGKERLTRDDKDSSAQLQVKWLHGAVAKKLQAKIDVTVNQMATEFKGYPGYTFDNPLQSVFTDQQTVFDGKVDEEGKAKFSTHLKIADAAPGMLRAFFTTKVFEEGGDFSIDRYSIPYSPYSSYVGLDVPKGEGYGGMLDASKTHYIDVATISSDGKPVTRPKLNLKIYDIEWRWWWDHSDNDVASYLARSSTVPVLDSSISTVNGKGKFRFNLWTQGYGRYLIMLTDPVSGHTAGKVVYVDWPWWSRGHVKENENATMLSFSSDKEKYMTGETMRLTIPSSSGGRALICIESGTKVLKKIWVPTTPTQTRYEMTVTPDMAPYCYLHVALIQPHNKTKNDLPIRMYGVIPIQVDNPASHLEPVITMPDVLKPEGVAMVHVKEAKGKPMAYTLAIVDEGLLDLTRFKTPDPWKTFNAKEALGVKTWDIYDLVMGAYTGKMDKILSIGGDGDGLGRKGTKANRFKPVVRFVGPFRLKPGQEALHKITMPNYVGSVRVMVVAGEDGAYGQTEKTVPVRKPLMILATLPRVLGPGETVSLPVDVFAMEKQVQDVKIEVQSNDLLVMETPAHQNIHFREIGDEVINYQFKVAEKTGVAKVKVIATCGKERTEQYIELDVRTPNPPVSDVQETIVEAGKSWDATVAYRGLKGTNGVLLEASSIPSINLGNRLSYLLEYPHGCIEQTTSSVFPQLLVGNLMELKADDKAKITYNIKAGLKRLQLFQTGNGGFSYWPFQTDDSEWGSNYAGHFMIEAEKRGYDLPHGMKARWVKYQQNAAKQWMRGDNRMYNHPHGEESYEVIQAYRLYTLALASAPEIGAMNRLREEKALCGAARWRLAAAYQLIGQTEIAKEITQNASVFVSSYVELSYSYGSAVRDEAMILETLCLMNDRVKAAQLVKTIAKALNSNEWMNTQETAYCLLSMCRFSGANSAGTGMKFSYSLNGASSVQRTSVSPVCQLKLSEDQFPAKGKVQITNQGTGVLYVKIVVRGVPLQGDQSSASSNLFIDVKYTNLKGVTIDPDKMIQGTDFIAEVKITNPGTRGSLKEMALNQIFPSGWEIHNSRMDENVSALVSAIASYQDIRDDRIYSYYNIEPNESKTFRVLLNATYLGRFYLPTVSSEAMYDKSINARVPGRWVEVVKETGAVAKK